MAKRKSAFKYKKCFEDLNRPLSPEEREKLKEAIERDGVREPVIVMQGDVLVDGFNRDAICMELGRDTPFKVMTFDSDEQAIDWAIRQQLARRNLTTKDFNLLLGRLYNGRKKSPHRPKSGKSPEKQGSGKGGHSVPLNKTADEVAQEAGVSDKTVKRSGKYAEAYDSLAKAIQKFVDAHDAAQKDVIELAAYDAASQKAIVASVTSGEYKTLRDSLRATETEEDEPADPLEAWRSECDAQHTEALKELRSAAKRMKSIADDPRGTYLANSIGRLLRHIDQAKAYVSSAQPVEIRNGEIVTKNHVKSREK